MRCLRQLESDHGEAATIHDDVERLYANWIGENVLTPDEGVHLAAITEKLQQLYKSHIQIEEEQVFPFAAAQLDRNTVAAMGAEFKARRESAQ